MGDETLRARIRDVAIRVKDANQPGYLHEQIADAVAVETLKALEQRYAAKGYRTPQMLTEALAAFAVDPLVSQEDHDSTWRLVHAGEVAPLQGGHGSWVETDHPAVIDCMGSASVCAQNGCQWKKIETLEKKWLVLADQQMQWSRDSDAKGDGANSHTERARARIYRECAADFAALSAAPPPEQET